MSEIEAIQEGALIWLKFYIEEQFWKLLSALRKYIIPIIRLMNSIRSDSASIDDKISII